MRSGRQASALVRRRNPDDCEPAPPPLTFAVGPAPPARSEGPGAPSSVGRFVRDWCNDAE
jgi:hypothetical protein